MARARVDPREERRRLRESRRGEFERRQAERLSKAPKVKPFDPDKFVAQIRLQAWATIHTVLYAAGLTAAFVLTGRALGAAGGAAFAALLGIGSLFYYLLRFWDIDLRKLGKITSQIGVFLTYFITWIMVSFLLSNPPVYDGVAPEIRCCGFYIPAKPGSQAFNHTFPDLPGEWSLAVPFSGLASSYTVNASDNQTLLEFGAYDGSGVSRVTLGWVADHNIRVNNTDLPLSADGAYRHVVTGLEPGTSWTFFISAYDAAEHVSTATASVTVV